MCRYGFHNYKRHFACFGCRKGFKRPLDHTGTAPTDPAPCPDCGRPMADMGLDFKTPPRDDAEQWAVVEHLFRLGFDHHSCGCGARYNCSFPSRWAEVPAFLDANRERSSGERLLARFASR